MGFFSRLGNKISHAYDVGSRIGMKALGTASRIGHKVSEVGHSVLSAVDNSPLNMVPFVATGVNIGKKILSAVDKGTALADKGLGIATDIDKVVKSARSSLEKPTAKIDAGIQSHPRGKAGGHLREEMKPKPAQRVLTAGASGRAGGRG
jgi:hypothetical protein